MRTADGTEREVDVIVLATGFHLASAPENYRTRPVHGRDGFDLADHYERQRLKAYESISMPGLPNHFMIFGPYGWTGASWHVLVESASKHIVRVIDECRRRGATEVEVTEEATDRYHEFVLRRMSRALLYGSNCATANSYYYDQHGDTPYLRPSSGRAAFKAARSFPIDDYRFTQPPQRARAPAGRRGGVGSTPEMDAERRRVAEQLYAESHAYDQAREDRLERFRNVEPPTAELLGVVIRATGAERILELGTSNGYSTIWLADAAQSNGGGVVTVDTDATRTELARASRFGGARERGRAAHAGRRPDARGVRRRRMGLHLPGRRAAVLRRLPAAT